MIRKAQTRDVDDILRLINLSTKGAKVLSRSKTEIEINLKNFFVNIEAERIVACVSLEIYSPKLAEIRSLVVEPTYQGKGIGTKLVQRCIKAAKGKGVFEILAITDRDQFFWRLGFRKSLENQWPMFLKMK